MMLQDKCPCGSDKSYSECCAPLHRGESCAASAEELMRSRYSAYVTLDASYLTSTWHKTTRPTDLELEPTKWLGLKITSTEKGLASDSEGWVTFVARYKINGRAHRLEEKSFFKKEDGVWFYVDAAQ